MNEYNVFENPNIININYIVCQINKAKSELVKDTINIKKINRLMDNVKEELGYKVIRK